jgi:predicted MPP superfamily phosphohydrolase
MSETAAPAQRKNRSLYKRVLWSLASQVALEGLYPGGLHDDWLRVNRRDIRLPGLGTDFDGAVVAQLSDLHCSPLVSEEYIGRCLKALWELRPDYVALTGDLITGPRAYAIRLARTLAQLAGRVPVLACLGNHDYGLFHPNGTGMMRGLAEFLSCELWKVGVTVLNNDCRTFRRGQSCIQFVGVEDLWTEQYNPSEAFGLADKNTPTIALCHNPDGVHDMIDHGAHLVLAGHTHGKPTPQTRFNDIFTPTAFRGYVAGLYAIGADRFLYVNRGIGHARRVKPEHRPEITLLTLRAPSR